MKALTENAGLRALRIGDAERMLEWMHSEDVTRYLQIDGKSKTISDAIAFIESARQDETVNLHRAIVDGDDRYLGTVSLKHIDRDKREAEYAICLHEDAIGRGCAKFATDAILQIAFRELGLDSVYLNVLDVNARAKRFYEKYGFQYRNSTALSMNGEERVLRWYVISNPHG